MLCLNRFALLNNFFSTRYLIFMSLKKCRFRKWFRSLLVERGGSFSDVFRSKHPERWNFVITSSVSIIEGDSLWNFCLSLIASFWISNRKDAFTCWSSSSGAEQFNYGSRIDHILVAGSYLHQDEDKQGHSFLACHVKECDILTEYKRFKNENMPTR